MGFRVLGLGFELSKRILREALLDFRRHASPSSLRLRLHEPGEF